MAEGSGDTHEDVEDVLDDSECEQLNNMASSYLNEMRIKVVEESFSPFGQKLLVPNRALIGQGHLMKICKKRNKKRGFFLFSDVLVYGGIALTKPTKKYNGQQILSLYKMKVEPLPDAGDMKNAFTIYTPKKSFTLLANSPKEKEDWINHLRKCAMYCEKQKYSEPPLNSPDLPAPVWISDSNASGCMVCSRKFTLVNRRHHCRCCGMVVCADCSKSRHLLPNISTKDPQRVCRLCLEKLLKIDEAELAGAAVVTRHPTMLSTYNTSDSSDDSDYEDPDECHRLEMNAMKKRTESTFFESDAQEIDP